MLPCKSEFLGHTPFSKFFTLREVNVMRMRWTCATSSSWPGLPTGLRADICTTDRKHKRQQVVLSYCYGSFHYVLSSSDDSSYQARGWKTSLKMCQTTPVALMLLYSFSIEES